MKRVNQLLVAVVIFLVVYGCNNEPEIFTTQSGYKMKLIEAGDGEVADPGNMLFVDMIVKDQNDSVWMNTYLDGAPRTVRKVDSLWRMTLGGIEEVIFYLQKGDSVEFELVAGAVYTRGLPPNADKHDVLKFNMRVVDAMDQESFKVYREELREKQLLEASEKAKVQLKKDVQLIDDYLAEKSLVAQKTESGLRYIITQEGLGDKVQSGQKIKANYSGHVLNGAFFDSSIEEVAKENGVYDESRPYGPFETAIGVGRVIKGWDEAFQLLNAGSKAKLYIPSGLAYGPNARSEEIPANSILVFDVELIEIISE